MNSLIAIIETEDSEDYEMKDTNVSINKLEKNAEVKALVETRINCKKLKAIIKKLEIGQLTRQLEKR